MRNLVLLFLRFGHFILFVLLELFCLYLIVNYNRKQRDIWGNTSNIFMGQVSEKWNDVKNYYYLQDEMDELAAENAKLKEKLINFGLTINTTEKDSVANNLGSQFELLTALVTNNSTHKPNNYIYINKGSADGVQPDMGVISSDGIVGIINKVRKNSSVANSLLHRRSYISAMIKRTGAFGPLRWIDTDPRFVNLNDIAKHNTVEVGDTIISSGYSTHFPPGILIWIVQETNLPEGSNFHNIKVLLNNDFGSLRYVQIIKNLKQAQQRELEKEVSDE